MSNCNFSVRVVARHLETVAQALEMRGFTTDSLSVSVGHVWRAVRSSTAANYLTLEGADEVAPEPGLLGEGGVVGVEVEVHLAHSGVAAAHPETQSALETQTSSSCLMCSFQKTSGPSKKNETEGPNRSSQTATYLEFQQGLGLQN